MIRTYARDGVQFRYPANWSVETDEGGEGGWTVTLRSNDTAFLLVSLRPDAEDPAQVADEALEALKAEYKELDAATAVETIAGTLAIGHDIDFLTVDTPILCRTRCLQTDGGPLLVLSQTSEYDREKNEMVLSAVIASLTLAAD